jgi:hypothetical protein
MMGGGVFTFLVGAALVAGADATAMGALKLDNMTLAKMVEAPGMKLLVKFDKSYAYGDKEDAFKEICKLAYPLKDFLIGEVPVQEYGDKENEDLQNQFEIKTEEFPVYILFKGSMESKVKFTGFPNPTSKKPTTWDDEEDGDWEAPMINEPTAENMIIWLRTNGIRMPSIGTIAELDEIVQRFLTTGMKDADIDAAKKLAAEDFKSDKKAPVYVKIFEKVKAKGEEYVATELARVEKLMQGKITPEKQAELKDKVTVLKVFANKDL